MTQGLKKNRFDLWKRLTAGITLFLFLASQNNSFGFNTAAQAAEVPAISKALFLSGGKIEIPEALGSVEASFQGAPGKPIVIVQDAHSIPDAQKNIQRIIQYFQTEYGADAVGLEGASSRLDPQIFRSFPDKIRLKKVFKEYLLKGELSGGTAAAMFSENPNTVFYGVEDRTLYEEGIRLYQKALGEEESVFQAVQSRRIAVEEKKKRQYSKELLQVDRLLRDFHQGQGELSEVLKKLASVQRPESGTELLAILEELESGGADQPAVQAEVREISEGIKKNVERLAYRLEKSKGFNQQYQQFQTGQLSPQAFALYLKEFLSKNPALVSASSKDSALKSLSRISRNQKTLRDIEGTKFFFSFETYAAEVKARLMTGEAERRIDRENREIELLEKMAKLQLTREEWEEVKTLRAQQTAFSAEDIFFGSKQALLSAHKAFYENAESRDAAFGRNLLGELGRSELASEAPAVFVAGGFHARGVMKQLREQNVSYLLIMPAIDKIPEETNYQAHMRGDVSWKEYFAVENGKVNLYQAFVRAARDQLLGSKRAFAGTGRARENLESAEEADGRRAILKLWRDQIIRDLADQGRLSASGRYTRYLDEAAVERGRAHPNITAESLDRVDQFISGLRELARNQRVTAQNILNILKPASAVPPSEGPLMLTGELIPAVLLGVLRSEVRSSKTRSEKNKLRPPVPVALEHEALPDDTRSYIDRHHEQWHWISEHASEAIFKNAESRAQAAGVRPALRVIDFGSASGEEAIRLFYEISRSLERSGRRPSEWDIRISGVDYSDEMVLMAERGLSGRRAFYGAARTVSGYASDVVEYGNENLGKLRQSLSFQKGDIQNAGALQSLLPEADLIFVNHLLRIDERKAAEVVRRLESAWPEALIALGDRRSVLEDAQLDLLESLSESAAAKDPSDINETRYAFILPDFLAEEMTRRSEMRSLSPQRYFLDQDEEYDFYLEAGDEVYPYVRAKVEDSFGHRKGQSGEARQSLQDLLAQTVGKPLDLKRPLEVLDVGTGTGIFPSAFQSELEALGYSAKVLGVDIKESPEARRALGEGYKILDFKNAEAVQQNLGERTFDLIVMNAPNILSTAQNLREISILRPGGFADQLHQAEKLLAGNGAILIRLFEPQGDELAPDYTAWLRAEGAVLRQVLDYFPDLEYSEKTRANSPLFATGVTPVGPLLMLTHKKSSRSEVRSIEGMDASKRVTPVQRIYPLGDRRPAVNQEASGKKRNPTESPASEASRDPFLEARFMAEMEGLLKEIAAVEPGVSWPAATGENTFKIKDIPITYDFQGKMRKPVYVISSYADQSEWAFGWNTIHDAGLLIIAYPENMEVEDSVLLDQFPGQSIFKGRLGQNAFAVILKRGQSPDLAESADDVSRSEVRTAAPAQMLDSSRILPEDLILPADFFTHPEKHMREIPVFEALSRRLRESLAMQAEMFKYFDREELEKKQDPAAKLDFLKQKEEEWRSAGKRFSSEGELWLFNRYFRLGAYGEAVRVYEAGIRQRFLNSNQVRADYLYSLNRLGFEEIMDGVYDSAGRAYLQEADQKGQKFIVQARKKIESDSGAAELIRVIHGGLILTDADLARLIERVNRYFRGDKIFLDTPAKTFRDPSGNIILEAVRQEIQSNSSALTAALKKKVTQTVHQELYISRAITHKNYYVLLDFINHELAKPLPARDARFGAWLQIYQRSFEPSEAGESNFVRDLERRQSLELKRAHSGYSTAYEQYVLSAYAGSNVVRTLLYAGRWDEARKLAPLVRAAARKSDLKAFWTRAQLLEMSLVLGKQDGIRRDLAAVLRLAGRDSETESLLTHLKIWRNKTTLPDRPVMLDAVIQVLEFSVMDETGSRKTVLQRLEDFLENTQGMRILEKNGMRRSDLLRVISYLKKAKKVSLTINKKNRLLEDSVIQLSGYHRGIVLPNNSDRGGIIPDYLLNRVENDFMRAFLEYEEPGKIPLRDEPNREAAEKRVNDFIERAFHLVDENGDRPLRYLTSPEHQVFDEKAEAFLRFTGARSNKLDATSLLAALSIGFGDCRPTNMLKERIMGGYDKYQIAKKIRAAKAFLEKEQLPEYQKQVLELSQLTGGQRRVPVVIQAEILSSAGAKKMYEIEYIDGMDGRRPVKTNSINLLESHVLYAEFVYDRGGKIQEVWLKDVWYRWDEAAAQSQKDDFSYDFGNRRIPLEDIQMVRRVDKKGEAVETIELRAKNALKLYTDSTGTKTELADVIVRLQPKYSAPRYISTNRYDEDTAYLSAHPLINPPAIEYFFNGKSEQFYQVFSGALRAFSRKENELQPSDVHGSAAARSEVRAALRLAESAYSSEGSQVLAAVSSKEMKQLWTAGSQLVEKMKTLTPGPSAVLTLPGSGHWAGRMLAAVWNAAYPSEPLHFYEINGPNWVETREKLAASKQRFVVLDDAALTLKAINNIRPDLERFFERDQLVYAVLYAGDFPVKTENFYGADLSPDESEMLRSAYPYLFDGRFLYGEHVEQAVLDEGMPFWHLVRKLGRTGVKNPTLREVIGPTVYRDLLFSVREAWRTALDRLKAENANADFDESQKVAEKAGVDAAEAFLENWFPLVIQEWVSRNSEKSEPGLQLALGTEPSPSSEAQAPLLTEKEIPGLLHDLKNVVARIYFYTGEVIAKLPEAVRKTEAVRRYEKATDLVTLNKSSKPLTVQEMRDVLEEYHELSQPAVLKAFKAELQRGLKPLGEDGDNAYLLMEDILKDFERVREFTRIWLGLSEDKPEPRDLRLMLNRVAESFEGSVRKDYKVPAGTEVITRANEFDRILRNLLKNAVEAFDTGKKSGKIDLRTRLTADGDIRIEVEDNGTGIAPDKLQKIWEPDYTTKSNGTGIGLATVREKVAEELSGTIDVQSELGKGTLFTIEIPADRLVFQKYEVPAQDEAAKIFKKTGPANTASTPADEQLLEEFFSGAENLYAEMIQALSASFGEKMTEAPSASIKSTLEKMKRALQNKKQRDFLIQLDMLLFLLEDYGRTEVWVGSYAKLKDLAEAAAGSSDSARSEVRSFVSGNRVAEKLLQVAPASFYPAVGRVLDLARVMSSLPEVSDREEVRGQIARLAAEAFGQRELIAGLPPMPEAFGRHFVVVDDRGRITGEAQAVVRGSLAELKRLVTAKSQDDIQGRGQALLNQVLQGLRQDGFYKVRITLPESALPFYSGYFKDRHSSFTRIKPLRSMLLNYRADFSEALEEDLTRVDTRKGRVFARSEMRAFDAEEHAAAQRFDEAIAFHDDIVYLRQVLRDLAWIEREFAGADLSPITELKAKLKSEVPHKDLSIKFNVPIPEGLTQEKVSALRSEAQRLLSIFYRNQPLAELSLPEGVWPEQQRFEKLVSDGLEAPPDLLYQIRINGKAYFIGQGQYVRFRFENGGQATLYDHHNLLYGFLADYLRERPKGLSNTYVHYDAHEDDTDPRPFPIDEAWQTRMLRHEEFKQRNQPYAIAQLYGNWEFLHAVKEDLLPVEQWQWHWAGHGLLPSTLFQKPGELKQFQVPGEGGVGDVDLDLLVYGGGRYFTFDEGWVQYSQESRPFLLEQLPQYDFLPFFISDDRYIEPIFALRVFADLFPAVAAEKIKRARGVANSKDSEKSVRSEVRSPRDATGQALQKRADQMIQGLLPDLDRPRQRDLADSLVKNTYFYDKPENNYFQNEAGLLALAGGLIAIEILAAGIAAASFGFLMRLLGLDVSPWQLLSWTVGLAVVFVGYALAAFYRPLFVLSAYSDSQGIHLFLEGDLEEKVRRGDPRVTGYLFHEWTHQLKQAGLIQDDRIVSSVQWFVRYELEKEKAEASTASWVPETFMADAAADKEPSGIKGLARLFWWGGAAKGSAREFQRGYDVMKAALAESQGRAWGFLDAADTLQTQDLLRGYHGIQGLLSLGLGWENYGHSIRLGGMAAALSDTEGSETAWHFLRILSQGDTAVMALMRLQRGDSSNRSEVRGAAEQKQALLRAVGGVTLEGEELQRRREAFMNYDRALRAVMPQGPTAEWTVISGAAGPSIRDLFNSTGFTKAYLIDEIPLSLEKLRAAHKELMSGQPETAKNVSVASYRQKRDAYGYASSALFSDNVEYAVLKELEDLGVMAESLQFFPGEPDSGRIRILFELEGMPREVEWLTGDLKALPESLKKELKGKADVYYQRASQTLPAFYQEYLYQISRWVKPGGLLMLNDVSSGNELTDSGSALGPIEYEAVRTSALRQAEKGVEQVLGITEDSPPSAFYGWKMTLWRKKMDLAHPRSEVRLEPWHSYSVEEGIDPDLVTAELDRVRQDIGLIKSELADMEWDRDDLRKWMPDFAFTPKVIAQYAKAAAYLNQSVLNDPNMTWEKFKAHFLVLHREIGRNELISSAGKIIEDMDDLEINDILKKMFSPSFTVQMESEPLLAAASVFVQLVNVQGFIDGNKRTASLILNYILLKAGYGPFILTSENAAEYFHIVMPIRESGKVRVSEFLDFLETQVARRSEVRGMQTQILYPGINAQEVSGWFKTALSGGGVTVTNGELTPQDFDRTEFNSENNPWKLEYGVKAAWMKTDLSPAIGEISDELSLDQKNKALRVMAMNNLDKGLLPWDWADMPRVSRILFPLDRSPKLPKRMQGTHSEFTFNLIPGEKEGAYYPVMIKTGSVQDLEREARMDLLYDRAHLKEFVGVVNLPDGTRGIAYRIIPAQAELPPADVLQMEFATSLLALRGSPSVLKTKEGSVPYDLAELFNTRTMMMPIDQIVARYNSIFTELKGAASRSTADNVGVTSALADSLFVEVVQGAVNPETADNVSSLSSAGLEDVIRYLENLLENARARQPVVGEDGEAYVAASIGLMVEVLKVVHGLQTQHPDGGAVGLAISEGVDALGTEQIADQHERALASLSGLINRMIVIGRLPNKFQDMLNKTGFKGIKLTLEGSAQNVKVPDGQDRVPVVEVGESLRGAKIPPEVLRVLLGEDGYDLNADTYSFYTLSAAVALQYAYSVLAALKLKKEMNPAEISQELLDQLGFKTENTFVMDGDAMRVMVSAVRRLISEFQARSEIRTSA